MPNERDTPTVSVIVPAYNPGGYLAAAIQSVQDQTVTNWELIVVDDGSPQDIAAIVKRYPGVKLIRQSNRGQAIARNVGLFHARGEYVAFLDQDDLWKPTYLEAQMQSFASDRVAMSHTQFELINENGDTTAPGFGRHQTYSEMLQGSGICGSTTVVLRRHVCSEVGGFNAIFEPTEDYDLWLRIARSYETAFVPTVQAQYRIHGQNQTRRYRDTFNSIKQIMQVHERFAVARGEREVSKAARRGQRVICGTFGGQAFDQSREALRARKYRACIGDLYFAATHDPSYVFRSLMAFGFRNRLRSVIEIPRSGSQ